MKGEGSVVCKLIQMRCIHRQINKYLVMRAEQLKYVQAMSATSLPFLSFHLHWLSLSLCFRTSYLHHSYSLSLLLLPFNINHYIPPLSLSSSLFTPLQAMCMPTIIPKLYIHQVTHKLKFVFGTIWPNIRRGWLSAVWFLNHSIYNERLIAG